MKKMTQTRRRIRLSNYPRFLSVVSIKLILLTTVAVLAFPLQGFAQKPTIITQDIPEATSGSFYYVQIFAEGFEKDSVWRAEGLPRGLGIQPDTGVILGTPEDAGVFDVLVTVERGKTKDAWRSARIFRLNVLPKPAEAPQVHTAPLPEPEAEQTVPTQKSASARTTTVVTWFSAEADGISGEQMTESIDLYFSDMTSHGIWRYIFDKDCIRILKISDSGAEQEAAEVESLEMTAATGEHMAYKVRIKNIADDIENGDEVNVVIELVYFEGQSYSLSETVKRVRLNRVYSDQRKAELARDALTFPDILGLNASAADVTDNLTLPDTGLYGCTVSWRSSDSGVISDSGVVTRPAHIAGDKSVTLTATVTCSAETVTKAFMLTVKALAELPPMIPPEVLPELAPPVTPTPQTSQSSSRESGADTSGQSVGNAERTSVNVDNSGAVSRTAVASELKAALQEANGKSAVIKTQNAKIISLKTLRALKNEADANGTRVVIHADTLNKRGGVDARLYLKPEGLLEVTEDIKLGISTKSKRAEKTKRAFEKYFDNDISVISCEHRGNFGAALQIAAKVELPEDIGDLVFYSYDSESNGFSRIVTAYRVDANGYLRFTTKKAGDIIISNGKLKRKPA